MPIVKVNDREVVLDDEFPSSCYGKDWLGVLDAFDLSLPEDDFVVAATLSYRPVRAEGGTVGGKYRQLERAGYVQTVEFASVAAKHMAVRHYTIAHHNGAPPIVARWMVDMECQRLIGMTRDGAARRGSFEHLMARFADTREDFEIESDNADEACKLLNSTTIGGWWEWSDGELWLCAYEEDE